MQEKEKNTGNVSEEDIAASLLPLMAEYFEGTCAREGGSVVYRLPGGQTFRISVRKES